MKTRPFWLLSLGLPLALLLASSLAGPWIWPELVPREWTGRAWLALARQSQRWGPAAGVSLLLSLVTIGFSLAVMIPAAWSLSRRPRPWLESLTVLPILLPPLAWVGGLQGVMLELGLNDSFFGTVLGLVLAGAPYLLRALLEGYRLVGSRMIECARNLGGSPWFVLRRVELPLLAPALASGLTLVFLSAWSDYLISFFVGGGRVLSLSVEWYPSFLSSDRSLSAAQVLLFILPPLALWSIGDALTRRMYRRLGVHAVSGGLRV